MKKIMKSILIICLLLLGMGLTTLVAAQTEIAAKDTLIVKQFSIDSAGGQFKEELGPQEGRLTFRILAGTTTGLDSGQILQWLEDGTMTLSGVRFDTDRATSINENRLSVPFEFEQPLRDEYIETELSISGSDWIENAATPVSLYGGSHGVVDISLNGDGLRMAEKLVSRNVITAEQFSYEAADQAERYHAVPFIRHEQENRRRGGFIYRNRYWVVGAATLVASSTTAILLSGGDSTTYLPEPPGRPALR